MFKQRRRIAWVLCLMYLLPLALTDLFSSDVKIQALGEYSRQEAEAAYAQLLETLAEPRVFYADYRNDAGSTGTGPMEAEPAGGGTAVIGYEETAVYQLEAETGGYYELSIPYRVDSGAMNNLTLSLQLNGEHPFREAATLDVPLIWRDESKNFTLDSYGDEALPNQVRVDEVRTLALYDNTYRTTRPLELYLEEGSHEITLQNLSADQLELGTMTAQPREQAPGYAAYRSAVNAAKTPSLNKPIIVDAISYTEKNSSFIRLGSLRNPDVSPYDPVDRKINIIEGDGWNQGGQAITYSFEVPEDGDYALSLHYLNNKDDYSVFRTIAINGEVLFDELYDYAFPYTNRRWTNITLGEDGDPYLFSLPAGTHTLTLTATQGLLAEGLNALQLLIDHINEFALEIRKITGKDIDRNRTWNLTSYLPETEEYLEAYEVLITSLLTELSVYAPNGTDSSTLSFLSKAVAKIQKMREKPDELPLYFEDLYSGTGSVTQMLGDTIDRLNNAGLSLNAVYLGAADTELPAARANFLERIRGGIANFISTFTSDKYLIRPDEDAVNVWVSRPITYVDIMQKQVDANFTPSTGIKVKLSVMPDANKLILSNAAGKVPDVALGLPSYMPYDIAIRGASYPLTEFDDFWEVAAQSTPGAFIPYVFNDQIYALPETLDFQALIYRKDVFRSLGLEVPQTWEEILGILPVLQRYGMNFYHNIAGGVGTKWFYQTSPLIYQNGGALYQEDGYYAAIDQPEAVLGLTQLAELFTTYSLPNETPNFYNAFRYNQLPIGMVDFNTYLQVMNAAPELKGQWELADFPGIEDENGEIQRWFIANGTGAVIMDKSEHPEDAWEFLKWWTSAPTQSEYANLLTSTYGPQYIWFSSNLEAARNAPIPEQDKEVILRQVPWLRDVPRTPGQYMLERGLSDVWSQAVQDGVVPRVAIDQQMIVINREIRRKMLEFGFIDQDGNQLRPYVVRDIDWIEQQVAEAAAARSAD